jgi:hypothetical protein
MIGQDYHLLGGKPCRIKSSDEQVGAKTSVRGCAAWPGAVKLAISSFDDEELND